MWLACQMSESQNSLCVVGFPLEFDHGEQVWPKKCTMQRPIKKSFHVITASERRTLNGDDHMPNCHNMKCNENILKVTQT